MCHGFTVDDWSSGECGLDAPPSSTEAASSSSSSVAPITTTVGAATTRPPPSPEFVALCKQSCNAVNDPVCDDTTDTE